MDSYLASLVGRTPVGTFISASWDLIGPLTYSQVFKTLERYLEVGVQSVSEQEQQKAKDSE